MSIYKLVTIDQSFIAETIARTGSIQLIRKATRSFVGLYDSDENWYIPLRANLGKKKPKENFFEMPFPTHNPHFVHPGLDFEKALFVPIHHVIEIDNTLPKDQALLIVKNQNAIRRKFEHYVVRISNMPMTSIDYQFSTVPLFPEGIKLICDKYLTEHSTRIKAEAGSSLYQ
jgi:hypothetical protein